ncbi:MAG: LCP family protein [Culicoidibacterales bacterium]
MTQEPFNVLLIGMDEENLDTGRADSLNVATINPQMQTMQMTSIPRDTYVEIPCKNNLKDKITHAHAYGGTTCTIETVELLLDTQIDFYVKINFNGFVDVIDAIGGIEVNVPDLREGFLAYIQNPDDEGLIPFPEQMKVFQEGNVWCESDSSRERYAVCFDEFGLQHVNGEQALALARTRHYDSDGDRGNRQMEVVKAVAKKMLSVEGVLSLNKVLDAAANNIATNISINQMTSLLSLAQNILAARGGDISGFAFRTLQIQGDGFIFEGELNGRAWYMIPYLESINYLRQQISIELGLTPVTMSGMLSYNANNQYPRPETISGFTPMFSGITPSEDDTPVIENDPVVVPPTITEFTCPDGQTSVNGVCPDPIVPEEFICPDGQTSVNGVCPDPIVPEEFICPDGQTSVNGVCPDPIVPEEEPSVPEEEPSQPSTPDTSTPDTSTPEVENSTEDQNTTDTQSDSESSTTETNSTN